MAPSFHKDPDTAPAPRVPRYRAQACSRDDVHVPRGASVSRLSGDHRQVGCRRPLSSKPAVSVVLLTSKEKGSSTQLVDGGVPSPAASLAWLCCRPLRARGLTFQSAWKPPSWRPSPAKWLTGRCRPAHSLGQEGGRHTGGDWERRAQPHVCGPSSSLGHALACFHHVDHRRHCGGDRQVTHTQALKPPRKCCCVSSAPLMSARPDLPEAEQRGFTMGPDEGHASAGTRPCRLPPSPVERWSGEAEGSRPQEGHCASRS